MDTYCSDKKCDCRRAIIQVREIAPQPSQRPLASISYGWEPLRFYQNWGGSLGTSELSWFKGPALDPYQPQSDQADLFLQIFADEIAKSADYQQRFIKHYAQYKRQIGMKLPKILKPHLGLYQPCGCGSEKTFKLCCGRKPW